MPNWTSKRTAAKSILVLSIGGASAFIVPTSAYGDAATILASFAGVVVAALVPTMILAATILRPVSRGKNEFQEVRDGVSRQISFFSGLFLLTVLLVALLFVGALFRWEEVGFAMNNPLGYGPTELFLPVGRIMGGSIVALATLIAAQMIAFVHGIKELFSLHADITERELDRIIRSENEAVISTSLPPDPRVEIGANIGELKH